MALSAAKDVPRKTGEMQSYPVYRTTKIYKGGLVNINATGYAIAATDTAGLVCVGVAYETVDNTSGSDGDLWVRVYRAGSFKLAATSITQAMVGQLMYVVDDATMDDTAGSTNKVVVGTLEQYESATSGWVNVGQRT
jgi:hypothetical protein